MSLDADSKVQCETCGKRLDVNFGLCLGAGWPKCCGYTMTLMRSPHGGDAMMKERQERHDDQQ